MSTLSQFLGGPIRVTTYTSGTGTHTFLAEAKRFRAVVLGGGGGGGRSGGGPAGGGGGGGGGAIIVELPVAVAGLSYAVGAPGVGATTNNTAGTSGGNSQLGAFAAIGGGGGFASGPGAGGFSTVTAPGYAGLIPGSSADNSPRSVGGLTSQGATNIGPVAGTNDGRSGGSSIYSVGGAGGTGTATATPGNPGQDAPGPGGGGGGGGWSSATTGDGGNGGPGIIIIEEYA